MPDHLHPLEQHSIHIIRGACARQKPLATLRSLGKDSNTTVWLERLRAAGCM